MLQLRRKIIEDICQPTKVCMLECNFKRLGWLRDDNTSL